MNKFIQIALSQIATDAGYAGSLIALDSKGDIYKLDMENGLESGKWDKMPDHPNAVEGRLRYEAEQQEYKRRARIMLGAY